MPRTSLDWTCIDLRCTNPSHPASTVKKVPLEFQNVSSQVLALRGLSTPTLSLRNSSMHAMSLFRSTSRLAPFRVAQPSLCRTFQNGSILRAGKETAEGKSHKPERSWVSRAC